MPKVPILQKPAKWFGDKSIDYDVYIAHINDVFRENDITWFKKQCLVKLEQTFTLIWYRQKNMVTNDGGDNDAALSGLYKSAYR